MTTNAGSQFLHHCVTHPRVHCFLANVCMAGALAFAGYVPTEFRKCGFAWSGEGAWRKYGCEAGGAHPPFAFALGQLEVLSQPTVSWLASSGEVDAFTRASEVASSA